MKDDRVYFEHILLCIEKIEDYTKMDRSLYMGSSIIQDAVVRNLQVLAESTQRISDRSKRNILILSGRQSQGSGIFSSTITWGLT